MSGRMGETGKGSFGLTYTWDWRPKSQKNGQ